METGEFSLSATATVGGSTVEDIAEQAVDEFDETLTQQDVFNRLTDNGSAQGIILRNGQLYINASYIQTGTLTLGGLNNQNGTLKVLNAAGQEIGTWTKDGISISEGEINLSRTELGVTSSVQIWNNALYPIVVDYSDNNYDYRTTLGGITPLIVRNSNDAHGFFVTPKSLSFQDQNGLPWFSIDKTDNTSGDDEYRLILGQYSVGDVSAKIYGDLTINGDLSVSGTVTDKRILQATSALSIPSAGSTTIGFITGLTSDHQLVRWNFSSSPENAPPANLAWETFDGYFTVTNNGGTTSESITPVFILPQ
jgi:hypothetical protein